MRFAWSLMVGMIASYLAGLQFWFGLGMIVRTVDWYNAQGEVDRGLLFPLVTTALLFGLLGLARLQFKRSV